MKKFLFFLSIIFVIVAMMVGSSIVLIFLGHTYAVYILVIGLVVTAVSNYLEKRA